MITAFLTKLSVGITTIALALSSFISPASIQEIVQPVVNQAVHDQALGAAPQFVGGKPYTLSGSGISSSATSITLSSFTLPTDSREIVTADLVGGVGDKFYITIEPNSTSKKEFVSCTAVNQSASTEAATLSGCTRGLRFTTPYTASSTLQLSHAGGARVVISNPPQLYQSIIDYINNATTSGAVDASQTVKGIVEVATGLEAASTTAVGSGGTTAPLALTTTISTSTKPSSGHFVVVTDIGGGLNNFIASTTIPNLTLNGTTTLTATTTYITVSSTSSNSTNVRITDIGKNFFIATSSTTWTVPRGVTKAVIEAVGAGGGGAGNTTTGNGGGGGAGGEYVREYADVSGTSSISITIGAGGTAGGGTGGAGGVGGTTTVSTFVTALGGGGAGNPNGSNYSGGIGRLGATGDINVQGNGGGAGMAVTANSAGAGGSSYFGGGGAAPGGSDTCNAGGNYGGGGSGGLSFTGGDSPGCAGSNGVVVITW